MEIKHTETPWTAKHQSILTNDGFCVAYCDGITAGERNATFIVNCVNERSELLAALKELIRSFLYLAEETGPHIRNCPAVRNAISLIDKAEAHQ